MDFVEAQTTSQTVRRAVTSDQVVAGPTLGVLDNDPAGDGEPAIDPVHIGDEPAAAIFIFQRRGAQVDHRVGIALVHDLIHASGIPECFEARALGILGPEAVPVITASMGCVHTVE